MGKTKNKWGKISIPPPDEILFYREVVCKNSSDLIPNSKLIPTALNHNIKLIFYPASKNISTSPSDGIIELTSFEENNNPNTYALNRHLRNAFCHLNIIIDGEMSLLRDSLKVFPGKKIQTTMTGKVKYTDLKDLIKSMIK